MRLSKGFSQVIIANILNLIISIGNGFLLPKYLSVESYANLKIFLLYMSYVGVLHFGYIDGIYIKYGGKSINEIDIKELGLEKKALIYFQVFISIFFIVIAGFLLDSNLLLAALCVLPYNMIAFYQYVYQATGEFKEYRYIISLRSILLFVGNLFFLFILKTDNVFFYIQVQIIVAFGVWFYYEKKNKIKNLWNFISLEKIYTRVRENIYIGIIVMLGNFMGIWITSIDRWFVKFLCSVAEFAHYSFAVTMLRLINVVINAFSVTSYNFFCREPLDEEIHRFRRLVLIIGAAIIAITFPLKFIIYLCLKKYIDAFPVIVILFAAQFILIEVNAVYMNLYKALNSQKKYLTQMVIVTMIAFISNAIIGYLYDSHIIAYAVATFLTAIVWLVLCQRDLTKYKMSNNEWIYILLTMIGYFICNYFSAWGGGSIYVCWILLETIFLFPRDAKYILCEAIKILKR